MGHFSNPMVGGLGLIPGHYHHANSGDFCLGCGGSCKSSEQLTLYYSSNMGPNIKLQRWAMAYTMRVLHCSFLKPQFLLMCGSSYPFGHLGIILFYIHISLIYYSEKKNRAKIQSKLVFNFCLILQHMSNLIFLILKSSDSFIILSTKIKMTAVVSLIEVKLLYYH